MRPVRDKVLVKFIKSVNDYIVLPDFLVEPTRIADVISVGERVTGVESGDRIITMSGVIGYETDYGQVLKEDWILGTIGGVNV